MVWSLLGWSAGPSRAQAPAVPEPLPGASAPSNSELLEELRALRKEVNEARGLKDQVTQLQNELANLKAPTAASGAPAAGRLGGVGGSTDGSLGSMLSGSMGDTYRGGQPRAPQPGDTPGDDFQLGASYRYNANATGPLGGGGYLHIGDPDDEFGINLTNQFTIDSTNYDRQNMPTTMQGFNIPFARTFLYGNITKDWKFQFGTQGFLGTFNILDMFMTYNVADWLSIRFGKGLAPPLYEYYAFSPALEPVIINSPLFQLAAGRPIGVMAMGNLLTNRIQYFAGLNNTGASFYYALDRNIDFNGAIDFTPFKGTGWLIENLGGGFGYSAGWQHYALKQSSFGFVNSGEATTNGTFITSSGVPFFRYNPNVWAQGERIRVSPHIYYYGRFSVLAEYMLHSRELTDGSTTGRSTQRGYYVNLSYYLTGERDFAGNGFQGYSTTDPLRPFIPSRGEWGPGAWQIAAQFSELNVGTGDFARGFADPSRWTNRLDQLMVGVNWWPNKYTRLSFDYVWTYFNRPIPVNSPLPIQTFDTLWFRAAMFF